MTPFRIGNIMLGTTDLECSLRFYSTMLDLPVQFQSTEMAFLDGGAITLCLSTPHAPLRTRSPGRPRWFSSWRACVRLTRISVPVASPS